MSNAAKIIVIVYLPWLLSMIVEFDPDISYFAAWLGSFFIFYITIFSSLAPYKTSENNPLPVMKPLILVQLIFAGFMCCTSIFYFLEHIDSDTTLISQCQRLSLLAHASLVSGMILKLSPNDYLQNISIRPSMKLILTMCFLSFCFAKLLDYVPSFIQLKYPLQVLSITSTVYVLVKGIATQKIMYAAIAISMFSIQFIESTLTGFKEGIIIQILTLIFISFHYYRSLVLILGSGIFLIALYVLPTYTAVFRKESWINGNSMNSAREQAYQTFFNEESSQLIFENNWEFLTNRFSEIGMFVKYIKHTPDHQNYIGSEILYNSLISIVPRVLWDQKPITEKIAMQRVYDASVVSNSSNVSAKTRPVVDGYLIAGSTGIFLLMLCYGFVTQILSNLAEKIFGGYELGTMIIFNSLFQQLWRGNAMEFLINNIIYGMILMFFIQAMMNGLNVFDKNSDK